MRENSGRGLVAAALALLGFGAQSEGAGFEIAGFFGPAVPTYKQSFTLLGGSPQFQFARLSPKTQPSLDAEGGLAIGASATVFLTKSFGIEARVDHLDVDLKSFGGTYALEIGPANAPISSTPVSLGAGETKVQSVRPLSVNLRYQSQRRIGLGFSLGLSYLPTLTLDATPSVGTANINASFPISLTARAADSDKPSHLGFNGGVGVQIKVAAGLSLVGEARGFAFKRSDLKWQSTQTGALGAVEQALLQSLTAKLEAPVFTPGFWTARVGVALRF